MPIDLPPFDIPKIYNMQVLKNKIRKPLYAGWFPGMGPVLAGMVAGQRAISNTPTTVELTSGTTWTVPSDYQPIGSTIDCYGAGGGSYVNPYYPGGGGGGAFARLNEFELTPGATVYIQIGAGSQGSNGTSTWFNKNSASAPSSTSDGALAQYGRKGQNYGIAGLGGPAATSIGHLKNSGGDGGVGFEGLGGAGGGAGGPDSDGGDGEDGGSNGGYPGGGYAGYGRNCYMTEGERDCSLYGGAARGQYFTKVLSDQPGYDGIIVITYYATL